MSIKVPDGGVLHCDSYFSALQWTTNGCSFHSEAKVLPLAHYDMIVGMDWLESFSPMKVDWKQKWLLIPYQGSTALLQGIQSSIPEFSVVKICVVLLVDGKAVQLEVPPNLHALLEEFSAVFQPPLGLPPTRACDHSIPLVPGATPVNFRPYRYPLLLRMKLRNKLLGCCKLVSFSIVSVPFLL